MAILLVESLTHRFRQAAGRLSRGTLILFAVIALGAGLSAWSRLQIGALLRVDDGAVLTASVADLRGDCGTPSLYVLPVEAGHQSTYRILVDFLGGANRFPTIGGGATVPVLALPAARPPGVGLGRGLEDRCEAMTLRIEGAFASPSVDADFPGEILPEETGLILADGFDGELVRWPPETPLAGARRKALVQRFARTAALRLGVLIDPDLARFSRL